MKYDFDKVINRADTNCVKYDLRKNVFGNPDVLPMWVADMDFETPDFAREAVMRRAAHPIYGYHFKDDAYFRSVENWLRRRHQWEVKREWMFFTPGVVCGFMMAVMALTKEGDEVLIQSPVYPPFHHAASNHGRNLVYNPLKKTEAGYVMDYDLLEHQVRTAKLVILCNPHNPVGRCWSRDELLRFGEICMRNGVTVISDEIHCDLVLPGYKHTPFASINETFAQHTVTFHAASKTFNLAGLATSTAIVPDEKLRRLVNSYVHSMEADLGNVFGKVATEAVMNEGDEWLQQLLQYIQGNVDYVAGFLSQKLPAVKFFKPQATYMMWLDFNGYGLSEEEMWRKMTQDAQLGFNRGSEFGQEGTNFFRVNLACPLATVKEAMRRLETTFG